jgi:hypothetical protein
MIYGSVYQREESECELRLGEERTIGEPYRIAPSHSFDSMPLNVPQNPILCFCRISRGTVCAMPCRNVKLTTTNPILGDTECFDLRRRKPFDWRAVERISRNNHSLQDINLEAQVKPLWNPKMTYSNLLFNLGWSEGNAVMGNHRTLTESADDKLRAGTSRV